MDPLLLGAIAIGVCVGLFVRYLFRSGPRLYITKRMLAMDPVERRAITAPLPPAVQARALALIRANQRVQAVKVIIEHTGVPLAEARTIMEALSVELVPTEDAIARILSRSDSPAG
jgi:hypothetical protein